MVAGVHTAPTGSNTSGAKSVVIPEPTARASVAVEPSAPTGAAVLVPSPSNPVSNGRVGLDAPGVLVTVGTPVVTLPVTRPPSVTEGVVTVVEEVKDLKWMTFKVHTSGTSMSASSVTGATPPVGGAGDRCISLNTNDLPL